MTVKNELSEIDGVQSVDGDADAKSVTVAWEAPATLDLLKERLNEINYPAA
jgi:copper chaperone CopZ